MASEVKRQGKTGSSDVPGDATYAVAADQQELQTAGADPSAVYAQIALKPSRQNAIHDNST